MDPRKWRQSLDTRGHKKKSIDRKPGTHLQWPLTSNKGVLMMTAQPVMWRHRSLNYSLTLSIPRSAIALRTLKKPWHLDDEACMKATVICLISHSTTLRKQLYLVFALFQLCRLLWSRISWVFSSLLCVFRPTLRRCQTGVRQLMEFSRISMFFLNVSTL